MALSRVRPQMRMVLVMHGRIKTQNLQRRTQGSLVTLEKIRTLLLRRMKVGNELNECGKPSIFSCVSLFKYEVRMCEPD